MAGLLLWLTICIYFSYAVIVGKAATEEREHVHIKVRMPDVFRKHYHKVHKQQQHHHHHPYGDQHQPAAKYHVKKFPQRYPQNSVPLELDVYRPEEPTYLQNSLPSILPSPVDLTANYGPVLFSNDMAATKQPLSPDVMNQQLMQQLFASAAMPVLPNNDVNAANTQMTSDFMAELQRLYYPDTFATLQAADPVAKLKTKKRKRQGNVIVAAAENDGFSNFAQKHQQYLHHQYLTNQAYGDIDNNNNNDNYYHQQQIYPYTNNKYNNFQLQTPDEEDLDENADDDDGSSYSYQSNASNDYEESSEEDTSNTVSRLPNPASFQDTYGAYTLAPITSQQATAPTRLNWRQRQRPKTSKHEPFIIPSSHLHSSKSINDIQGSSATALALADDYDYESPRQQQYQHHNQYQRPQRQPHRVKKRKNRIKAKRGNRIVVH